MSHLKWFLGYRSGKKKVCASTQLVLDTVMKENSKPRKGVGSITTVIYPKALPK